MKVQREVYSKIKSVWKLLNAETKNKLLKLTFAMGIINILDLLGIFLFATFASGVFDLVQQNSRRTRIEVILDRWIEFNPNRLHFLVIIAIFMLFAFVLKSALSALLNRRTLFFLANREYEFAALVLKKSLSKKAEDFYQKSPEEIHHAAGISVSRIFNGVLFPLSQLLNDGVFLFLVFLALLYTSPTSAILGIVLVGVFIILIGRRVHRATALASNLQVKNSLITQESIRELYEGYREIVTKDYASFNREKFRLSRQQLAYQQARILWLQQIPRFSLEIFVLISASILGAFEFLVNDTRTALVKLSVFMVTTFRVLPSIQRIQTSTLAINSGLVAAQTSMNVLSHFTKVELQDINGVVGDARTSVEIKSIEFQDVSYKYGESKEFTFKDINGVIEAGNFIGLTGESGVGKSTLVECIVDIRTLSRGSIVYRDKKNMFIRPSISYVPQKPFIINSNLLTNIALEEHVSEDRLKTIETLFNFFFRELAEEKGDVTLELETQVTSNSNSISGGQAQRIAIMRALLSNSDLFVFDECFSGLSESMTKRILLFLKESYPKKMFLIISHSTSILKLCNSSYKLTRNRIEKLLP